MAWCFRRFAARLPSFVPARTTTALSIPLAAAAGYLWAETGLSTNASMNWERMAWLEGRTDAALGPDCDNPVCGDKITNFRAM